MGKQSRWCRSQGTWRAQKCCGRSPARELCAEHCRGDAAALQGGSAACPSAGDPRCHPGLGLSLCSALPTTQRRGKEQADKPRLTQGPEISGQETQEMQEHLPKSGTKAPLGRARRLTGQQHKRAVVTTTHYCCTELKPASIPNLELFTNNWDRRVSSAPRVLQQKRWGLCSCSQMNGKWNFFLEAATLPGSEPVSV